MADETSEDDPKAIKTTTIGKLIYENGINEIDLLKIDVAGSEKEIFGAEGVDDWLSKVKVLSLVIHDELKTGASFAVFKAISKYKWKFSANNETLTFIRDYSE